MAKLWVVVMLALTLGAVSSLSSGCAPRRSDGFDPIRRGEPAGVREARPLDEEKSLADRTGEAGVAVLVVTVLLAGIALPIILLLAL